RGQMRAIPKASDVPGWVRDCVVRGFQVDPAERHGGFEDLLSALASDPIARRRVRLLAVGTSLLAAVVFVAVRHVVQAKRHEIEKQAAEHVHQADALLGEASAKRKESKTLRDRAL